MYADLVGTLVVSESGVCRKAPTTEGQGGRFGRSGPVSQGDAMTASLMAQISLDPGSPHGYGRTPSLQAQFDEAAAALLSADSWKTEDGTAPPGPPELRCDLALEGGGVKGIGLVGAVLALDEAGYRIQRVAGTSAGAIAAALVAALVQRGRPMGELRTQLSELSFERFMPEGPIRHLLHPFGKAGELAADVPTLLAREGLYSGDYLYTWLDPILEGLGIATFADLEIAQSDDPGMSLPEEKIGRAHV